MQSAEIIDIFKSLSPMEREFVMNRGTLRHFLKQCPYLGCYGSKFFVRDDGQNPLRVEENELFTTG
jgi:hypothetical protein